MCGVGGWGQGFGDQDKERTLLDLGCRSSASHLEPGHCSLSCLALGRSPTVLPFVSRGDKGMGPGMSRSLLTRGKFAVSPKAALSYLSTPLGGPWRGQQLGICSGAGSQPYLTETGAVTHPN